MEPPTKTAAERKFDLEERLLDFSVRIVRVTEQTPKTDAGRHVADQVFRSGTSPYANHGEAESAESTNDFVHKLKLCLKELRETWRWLRLIQRIPMVPKPELLDPLIKEADELIRIFRQSIMTCQQRNSKEGRT
jgi:four helix bundle protein